MPHQKLFSDSFRRLSQVLYSKRFLSWTNTATGTIFFGIGDFCVQKLVEQRPIAEIDPKRIAISCIAGTYMGFVGHHWYRFLDHRFAGTSMKAIRNKLAAELAVGPPFAASMFLLVGTLERKSMQTIWHDTKDSFHWLILADWGFYIPMQYFNFNYLPPKYRVLYVAAISIVYDSALVYLLHKNDMENTLPKTVSTSV